MNIDLTATVDLKRSNIKDANSAQMHNKHDPNVKHDNVQIIKEDTELNKHTVLLNRNELLKQQYQAMIDERNEKTRQRFLNGKIGQNEYKNRLTNVNKYLNNDGKKAKEALTNYVFTLGNVETEFTLLNQLGFKYERQKVKDSEGKFHDRPRLTDKKQREEFTQIMNETYVNLAKKINNSNAGIKVVDVWLHMDEGGMPHAQGEMVNMGHTNSGKPSYNLNQALGEFNKHLKKDVYTSNSINKQGKKSKSVNGRIALTNFRKIVDGSMISTFNEVAKKHGFDIQAKLVRTGGKSGLSMNEYQSKKQIEKEINDQKNRLKKIQEKQETAESIYKGLSSSNKALKSENDELTVKNDDLQQKAEQKQAEVEAKMKQFNEAKSQLAIVKQQKKDEEEKLNKLRFKRRQQQQLEAKADQYDQIKNFMGNVPENHTLASWVKNQFEFVQKQAKIGFDAVLNAEKLQKALTHDMNMHAEVADKDVKIFENQTTQTTNGLVKFVEEKYKQFKQKHKIKQQQQNQQQQSTNRKQEDNSGDPTWG